MELIRFGILTVSDTCYRGEAVDKSGPKLKEKVHGIILKQECIPDEIDKIEEILKKWSEIDANIDVILTTGGTGFGVRDVTPEATKRIITKETPAITTAITLHSLKITAMAMLSRSISGIRNNTLIINLPGSVKAAEECLAIIEPCLWHAVDLLRDKKTSIESVHKIIQSGEDFSQVKTTNIAVRDRVSPWPMISMDESIKFVMDNILQPKTHSVPLKEALGCVISCSVTSNDALPPFRASIKDGYAIQSQDGTGLREVLGGYSAGNYCNDIHLEHKTCVRVNTGSMIPESADAVIQVEDTELVSCNEIGEELSINILTAAKPGQDIRGIGSDIRSGEIVLNEGDLITSIEMGLLATVGVTHVNVYKTPTVAVLSTGNELLNPDQILVKGKIRDSNKTTLLSLLKENGFTGEDFGIAKDEPTELMRSLKKCMQKCDIIITTGSVSMGDKDYLKSVLKEDFSAEIHFGRVNMKPGKPTTFATCKFEDQKKLLFCLPGNPVSATVTFHLYVLPALKAMAGFKQPFPTEIKAKTETELSLDVRPEYKRGILIWDKEYGLPKVRTTGNQISSRLMSWRYADCLIKLPSSNEVGPKLPSNSLVTVLIVGKI